MNTIPRYNKTHDRRTIRARGKIAGSDRPRLNVHRSNQYMYAQVIFPDGAAKFGTRGTDPATVGAEVAKKALAGGVKEVVFDRGGYRYHGKVKVLAEAAREGGLQF